MAASTIRPATDEDLPTLQSIERAAGEVFRDLDMALVGDDDPFSIAELRGYLEGGRAWVVTVDDAVAGYLVADVVDGAVHIEQVSIDPRYARRGLGRDLIEACAAWARGRGYAALTLTAFVDVPWNGPYYRRLGFRQLDADEVTSGLRALREHEAERGLDRWPRVCLRLELERAPAS